MVLAYISSSKLCEAAEGGLQGEVVGEEDPGPLHVCLRGQWGCVGSESGVDGGWRHWWGCSAPLPTGVCLPGALGALWAAWGSPHTLHTGLGGGCRAGGWKDEV